MAYRSTTASRVESACHHGVDIFGEKDRQSVFNTLFSHSAKRNGQKTEKAVKEMDKRRKKQQKNSDFLSFFFSQIFCFVDEVSVL